MLFRSKEELAADLLESLSNIYKAVAAKALDVAEHIYKVGKPVFVKGFDDQVRRSASSLGKWTARFLFLPAYSVVIGAGGLLVTWLAATFPEYFSWLPYVVTFVKQAMAML